MPLIDRYEAEFQWKHPRGRYRVPTGPRTPVERMPDPLPELFTSCVQMRPWRFMNTRFHCSCMAAGCEHSFRPGDAIWYGPHLPQGKKTLCDSCYERMTHQEE